MLIENWNCCISIYNTALMHVLIQESLNVDAYSSVVFAAIF